MDYSKVAGLELNEFANVILSMTVGMTPYHKELYLVQKALLTTLLVVQELYLILIPAQNTHYNHMNLWLPLFNHKSH